MKKGRFIVFEGIDGSGKTTQARKLAAYLQERGRSVHLTAEPTSLPSGKFLRKALSGEIARSECQMAVMFTDDRIAHNIAPDEGIRALLENGVDVLCDRYYYSTLSYQGQSTDYAWVKSMNLCCPEIAHPDLCIYIDLLPEQSLERIRRGRESVEIYENLQTLTRVREQFLSVIHDLKKTDNICVIDGYRAEEDVFFDICRQLDKMMLT